MASGDPVSRRLSFRPDAEMTEEIRSMERFNKGAYAKLVEEMMAQGYNFGQMSEEVQDENRMADTFLQQAKEHFAKLKFNYVELNTKCHFLERLARNDDVDAVCPPSAEMQALEERVAQDKAKVRALKENNAALRESIVSLSKEVQEGHHKLSTKSARVTELADTVATLLAQYEDLKERQPIFSGAGGEAVTLADVDAYVAEMRAQYEQYERQKAAADAEAKALEAERERLAAETARLREELAAATSDLATVRASKHASAAKLEEMCDWYRALSSLVSEMSGVRLIECESAERLVVALTDIATTDILLTLHYTEEGTLVSVDLNPPVVGIEDIVQYAATKRCTAAFVVREIKTRIQCHLERASEMETLMTKFPMDWPNQGPKVVAQFGRGRFVIAMDPEYPLPHAEARLEAATNASLTLAELRERGTASGAKTVEDWLLVIQQALETSR